MRDGHVSFLPDEFPKQPPVYGPGVMLEAWAPVLGQTFGSAELERWLLTGASRFREGGLARELGRWLFAGIDKSGLNLESLEATPKTKRIDGVMSMTIPRPFDMLIWAEELASEALSLEFDWPESARHAVWLRELAVCLFAMCHGRNMRLSSGLGTRMKIDCPASPVSGRRSTLTLFGALPFGGQIVIATSPLKAAEWAADGEQVGFARFLRAERTDGKLLLRERVPQGPEGAS